LNSKIGYDRVSSAKYLAAVRDFDLAVRRFPSCEAAGDSALTLRRELV